MSGQTAIKIALLVVVLLTVAIVTAHAQGDLQIGGSLSQNLAYLLSSKDIALTRLTYKLELEKDLDLHGKVYTSWDGSFSYRDIPSGQQELSLQSTVRLDEAYADIYTMTTDLRLGQQIISWGTADGFNPTSYINPRSGLSASSKEILTGTPVPAVKVSYYPSLFTAFTGVLVLDFVPAADAQAVFEQTAEALSEKTHVPLNPVYPEKAVPLNGQQFELALRAETMVGNHSIYGSYFRGWDDYPAAWIESNQLHGKYRKVQKLGMATSSTIGDYVVWSECALTVPERISELDSISPSLAISSNQPYVEGVLGGEYIFPSSLDTSLQVLYSGRGSILNPYQKADEPQTYLIGRGRYSPRQGHTVEGIGIVNLSDHGSVLIPQYTFDINPATSLTIALIKVFADQDDELYSLKESAEMITAGFRISF